MGLSIDIPDSLSLLQEFKFIINGADNMVSPGGKIYQYLGFQTYPSDGDTLELTWRDKDITFTFKDAPDDSGLQLHTKLAMGLQEWLELVAEDLMGNADIYDDFVVSYYYQPGYPIHDRLEFAPREKGDYNITHYTSGYTTVINDVITNTPLEPEAKENYRILCQLVDENETVIDEKIKTYANPVVVHFGNSAKSELEAAFTKSPSSGVFLYKQNKLRKKFFCRAREYYGDPPEKYKSFKSQGQYALLGGINKFTQGLFNETGVSFWQKLQDKKLWLSSQPVEKTVAPIQVERLFYLHYGQDALIQLRIHAYFTDGTTSLVFPDSIQASKFDVIEVVLDPQLIKNYLATTKTLKKYQVVIRNGAGLAPMFLTKQFTYSIDRNIYENNRFFIFRNSLGGYDTIRMKGVSLKSGKYDFIPVNGFYDDDFISTDTENNRLRAEETVIYKVNSGWINNRQTVEWLRELFLSEEVYEIEQGYLIPVKIISNKSKFWQDKDYNYNLELQYERGNINEYYSNIFELEYLNGSVFNSNDFSDSDFVTEYDIAAYSTQNNQTTR